MRGLPFVILALAAVPSIAACKDKAKPQAKTGSGSGSGTGTGTGSAPAPVVDAAPDKPLLAPAEEPAVASDELCKATTSYFEHGFKAVGGALEVPADKLEGFVKALGDSFAARCMSDDWPENLLPCLTRQTADIFTYRRCFERLPTVKRDAWSAHVYELAAKAGGKVVEAPPAVETPPDGVAFENVCSSFVAEIGRFDACASGAMYLPEAEEVYGERRRVEVGGVVPAAEVDRLREVCATRAELTRKAATSFCPKLSNPPATTP